MNSWSKRSHSIGYLLALILIVHIATYTSTVTTTRVANAQQGAVQVESEGDLEATLNGESFTTGQTITISGTIEDPNTESFVTIEIIDPGSEVVVQAYPELTADNTFTFSFVAGEDNMAEVLEPMVRSGNYRVVVSFFENSGDFDIYEVEFDFAYAAVQQPSSPPAGSTPLPSLSQQLESGEQITGGAGGAATGITPQEGAPRLLPPTMFQSNIDGIRVGVPDGWVVEDLNNTDPSMRQDEQSYGAGVLVELCPQNQATPQIGGTYLCPAAEEGLDSVSIWRFADLKSRPEFAGVVQQNKTITTTDLMAYYFLFLEQKAAFTNFRVLENIDTTVNVIDPQISALVATAPAKYIEMTYLDARGIQVNGDFALLVLGNESDTGYVLLPVASVLPAAGELPPEHQLVFNTFELIAANGTTNATTMGLSSLSPFSQQMQQQQRDRLEMQQPLSLSPPQQQEGVQSDTSRSSTISSNTADTATNDDSPLGEISESMEDLFG